jgi:hypothetical protein
MLGGCANVPTPTPLPAAPLPPALYSAPVSPTSPAAALIEATPTPTALDVPSTDPSRLATPTPRPIPFTPVATATTQNATPTTAHPTLTPIVIRTPSHDLSALNEYQRGIAYISIDKNAYQSPQSDESLDLLFATGANYISLLVTWYQTDVAATDIHRADNTPSDEDLLHVINYAHAHGVHVLLKPQVNFTNDEAHWRGEISFKSEKDWQAWFKSYREFILYYARFAQQSGVEEFSVGTELFAASARTTDWRAIIRAVRAQYTGLLTYSANHSGEEVQVQFWDDLDFIGVNNFYHLTNLRAPTVDQLIDGWKLPVLQLTRLHARFPNQLIIFTEVGYPSLDRANVWPWNWERGGAVDAQEQADCFESLFRIWWKNPERPWFRGMFVWNWLANPDQGGPEDGDYTPHNKPAEAVIRKYYTGTNVATQ